MSIQKRGMHEMKIDSLSAEAQETVTYCHSCGEVRTEAQLGECLECGARICGLDGCSMRCFCDDKLQELIAEIDELLANRKAGASGNVLPSGWDTPGAEAEVTAIL